MWNEVERSFFLQEPETGKIFLVQIWVNKMNDQVACFVVMQKRSDGNQDKMKILAITDKGDMNGIWGILHDL